MAVYEARMETEGAADAAAYPRAIVATLLESETSQSGPDTLASHVGSIQANKKHSTGSDLAELGRIACRFAPYYSVRIVESIWKLALLDHHSPDIYSGRDGAVQHRRPVGKLYEFSHAGKIHNEPELTNELAIANDAQERGSLIDPTTHETLCFFRHTAPKPSRMVIS
ncbi:hypothetical protein VTN96DRAFT_7629 [Rasamsonia emersonii]